MNSGRPGTVDCVAPAILVKQGSNLSVNVPSHSKKCWNIYLGFFGRYVGEIWLEFGGIYGGVYGQLYSQFDSGIYGGIKFSSDVDGPGWSFVDKILNLN